MFTPALGLLYLPVLVWVATGVSLLIAFRRSGPPIVLRLAATFLALWALLATTALVWVISNGGWIGVVSLTREPLEIFDPRFGMLWVLGGIGAFCVLTAAFSINQLLGRGFLLVLHPRPIEWPRTLPRPPHSISLWSFPSPRVEAFSFALLRFHGPPFFLPYRHECILLSETMLLRFTPTEVAAVVAHEVGHVLDLDGRYLTFFRTLSRMMRWDPLLAFLANSLTSREEYRADDQAVRISGRPLALARALFKATQLPVGVAGSGRASFLGVRGRRGQRETHERIRRLVRLAESGLFAEEPLGLT